MRTITANSVTRSHRGYAEGLAIGVFSGLAFLVLSLARIYGDMRSALFSGEATIAAIEYPVLEMQLGARLLAFGAALVLVHILLGILAWLMAIVSKLAWPGSNNSQRVWTALWISAAFVWALTANAAWFPSSSLGYPYAELVQEAYFGISLFQAVTCILVVALGVTLVRCIWRFRDSFLVKRPVLVFAAVVVLIGGNLIAIRESGMTWRSSLAGPVQPNIIMIGLDSFRVDILAGPLPDSPTPNIKDFYDRSAAFTDTRTPLARTFSAWVSILTGRHPHTTGANVNLMPRDLIDTGETLPDLLRASGYRTVYGIDEVRFSNIDESYGFDRTVGPRIGSADFLIEFFGDTPLSNLVVNTRLGDALFPELHGNRAANVTYNPDTFIDDLERSLHFGSPTFLAVHLTLAHWPFTWSASAPRSAGQPMLDEFPALYDAAISRLDRQFADLIAMLQSKGALENAIVLLLSDHGESLGEINYIAHGDGAASALIGKPEVFGHGTHVFSDEQYDVLLGFRTFGDAPAVATPGARITHPASLEDITPTLVELLGLDAAAGYDGISLVPYLDNSSDAKDSGSADRFRFVETEFNPPGVAVDEVQTASAISRASASYRIDPVTDRVEIRREQLDRILVSRQYAVTLGSDMLASVPAQDLRSQHLIHVRSEHSSFEWLAAAPVRDEAPVAYELWAALKNKYAAVAERPVLPPPSDSTH